MGQLCDSTFLEAKTRSLLDRSHHHSRRRPRRNWIWVWLTMNMVKEENTQNLFPATTWRRNTEGYSWKDAIVTSSTPLGSLPTSQTHGSAIRRPHGDSGISPFPGSDSSWRPWPSWSSFWEGQEPCFRCSSAIICFLSLAPKKKVRLNPVINRFQRQLVGWKRHYLSRKGSWVD